MSVRDFVIKYEDTRGVWLGNHIQPSKATVIVDVGGEGSGSLFVRGPIFQPFTGLQQRKVTADVNLTNLPVGAQRAIRNALTRSLAEQTNDPVDMAMAAVESVQRGAFSTGAQKERFRP